MIHIIVEQFCSKKAPLVKKNNRIMFYSPSQVSVLIATLTLNISDRPPPHRPTKLNSREFACISEAGLTAQLRPPPSRATRSQNPHKHKPIPCCPRLASCDKHNQCRRPSFGPREFAETVYHLTGITLEGSSRRTDDEWVPRPLESHVA